MRQEIRSILWVVPVLLVAAAGIIYFSLQLPQAKKNAAPDFTVTTLDEKTVSLSDLRGKPLFLNFWSSW